MNCERNWETGKCSFCLDTEQCRKDFVEQEEFNKDMDEALEE